MTFDKCLAILLHEEGGFSADPHDRGGITNLGVTIAVWRQWVHGPVSIDTMRALKPADVAPLYRALYWNAASCDALPPVMALCVFDFAVNAGVGRAARILQKVAGVTADGHIGPKTIAAVKPEMIHAYCDARRAYYRSLDQFPRYGRGWTARADRIENAAKGMT